LHTTILQTLRSYDALSASFWIPILSFDRRNTSNFPLLIPYEAFEPCATFPSAHSPLYPNLPVGFLSFKLVPTVCFNLPGFSFLPLPIWLAFLESPVFSFSFFQPATYPQSLGFSPPPRNGTSAPRVFQKFSPNPPPHAPTLTQVGTIHPSPPFGLLQRGHFPLLRLPPAP